MLGRPISYRWSCYKIVALWAPKGRYLVVDLDDKSYLVKFAKVGDYLRARPLGWSLDDSETLSDGQAVVTKLCARFKKFACSSNMGKVSRDATAFVP